LYPRITGWNLLLVRVIYVPSESFFLLFTYSSTDLVTRVLYRLRFQTERQPLDAGTYAFVSPLLSNAISKGGLGVARDETEKALEQLALAIDVIGFHVREGEQGVCPFQFAIADVGSLRDRKHQTLPTPASR
jgi:hypothetical protein